MINSLAGSSAAAAYSIASAGFASQAAGVAPPPEDTQRAAAVQEERSRSNAPEAEPVRGAAPGGLVSSGSQSALLAAQEERG